MKRSSRLPLLLLVFVTLVPATLPAQVLYGSIVGNVTDESGGATAGATVKITHRETGASRDTITDSAGFYRFPNVQSGTYTVTSRSRGSARSVAAIFR